MDALTPTPAIKPEVLASVLISGDLKDLQPLELIDYYQTLCHSLGLNPLSRPFELITLNNKKVFYATKNCTDQLRDRRHIDVQIVGRQRHDDLYIVTARARLPNGRTDEDEGIVTLGRKQGDDLANAMMRA